MKSRHCLFMRRSYADSLSYYLQGGYAEILLRKTCGPIYTYKKRQKE